MRGRHTFNKFSSTAESSLNEDEKISETHNVIRGHKSDTTFLFDHGRATSMDAENRPRETSASYFVGNGPL